jgi:hypothetical protein
MSRKRKRVWVDGTEYGTQNEAAKAAGISGAAVHDALKAGGRTVKGHAVAGKAPEEPPATAPEKTSRRTNLGPLLRYPDGTRLLYEWSRRWV